MVMIAIVVAGEKKNLILLIFNCSKTALSGNGLLFNFRSSSGEIPVLFGKMYHFSAETHLNFFDNG